MNYHENLKSYIHQYIKLIYKLTSDYPREELLGVTSQLRRASVSVMLNYVERYARRRGEDCKTYYNFLSIAYGSLKETKYLLYLSNDLDYINNANYTKAIQLSDNIGAML